MRVPMAIVLCALAGSACSQNKTQSAKEAIRATDTKELFPDLLLAAGVE